MLILLYFTRKVFPLICASLLLISCVAAPTLQPVALPPQQLPISPVVSMKQPVLAFVLGGGAARGFAHVGVLNVLEEHDISADIVVGTSSGSVVGAFYAGGIRGRALMEAAQQLDISTLTDWMFPNRGIVRGERLQGYVNQLLQGRPIEALPTRFAAVATELASGELIVFNHGDTGMAVRASSAIPGIVQPVTIGKHEYVDGGLVSQVPVRIAQRMGAEIVIAVDVSRKPLVSDTLDSTLAVMHQAIIIMAQENAKNEGEIADILIRPQVGEMSINSFELRDHAVAAGRLAALAVISEIKELIAKKKQLKHE